MGQNIIGTTLLDQYRVDEFIASGGMGSVYKVWDLKRNVPLAMKVLHTDFADDSSSFKYFQREARALQKLRHPNVVPFYGLFQTEQFAFLLEHYVDGPSLRDIISNYPNGMPIPETLAYMQALCSALGYAHTNGVVHCDIKPANVMVDRGGQVYLADFGIARHADSSTTTIAGAGTPAYMAPEQINSKLVVPAADVYSLGVLLYELLTGQRPFRGDEQESIGKGNTSGERIRYAQLHLPAPDPCNINPSIPPVLGQVVMKCMAKAPEDRYANMGELLSALKSLEIEVPSRVQLPNDERASTEQSPKIFPPNASISKRNFLPAWLAVIAVLGIAIVLLVGRLAFRAQVTPAPTVISTNMPQPSQPATTEISPYITPSDFGTPNVVNINTVLLPAITSTVPSVISQPEEPKTGATVISSSDGMAVVYIPAGDFFMGASAGDSEAGKDEFPQHIVYLDAFWVDKFEVTNAMFADFVQNTNYRTRAEIDGWSWEFDGQWLKPKGTNWRHPMDANSNLDGLDNHPVVRISHADAEAYCKWAGRRLLTEAEWEKAARGENGLAYPWSNQYSCGNANFGDSGCDSYLQTAPVGSYLDGASPYGVLDMAGNVWEWVADWYQEDYYKNTPYKNPLGPNSGDGFVMRGGSWSSDNRRWFRASWREWGYENDSYWSTGFRCGSNDAP